MLEPLFMVIVPAEAVKLAPVPTVRLPAPFPIAKIPEAVTVAELAMVRL